MTEPESNISVHVQLRQATHDQHVRLNHHPMLSGLLQPAYPLVRYRCLIAAYFRIYRAIEEVIMRYVENSEGQFDYAARRKLSWLAEDLNYFQDTSFSHCNSPELRLPAVENAGQLIGILYVIEGSTLGGRVILRALSEHHSLCGSAGARFFQGYGEQTQSNWQEFLRFAESIGICENMRRAAIQSAREIFKLFEDALNECVSSERGKR